MKKKPGLILFLGAFIVIGAIVTFIGAKDIYVKNVQSRNWIEVEAVYVGNEPYRGENNTYWLDYSYTVDGKEYTVTTDYVASDIPEPGSTETIKHDPVNPANAIFARQGANIPLFIAGLVFFAFPVLVIAIMLKRNGFAIILFGTIFIAFGILFYSVGFPIILALIFSAAGLFVIVKGIIARKNEIEAELNTMN